MYVKEHIIDLANLIFEKQFKCKAKIPMLVINHTEFFSPISSEDVNFTIYISMKYNNCKYTYRKPTLKLREETLH